MSAPKRARPADTTEAELLKWAAAVLGIPMSAVDLRSMESQIDLNFWVRSDTKRDFHDDYRVRLTGSHHAFWDAALPAAKLRVQLHEDGLWAHSQKAAANIYKGEKGAVALPHADPSIIAAISDARVRAVKAESKRRR